MSMKTEKKSEESKDLRISELAREIGVNRSHVSLILNGKRMPSLPVAGKLAKAMGVSLDELHARLVTAA
jgi:transcriptional regulator with XRE-family HTH domain